MATQTLITPAITVEEVLKTYIMRPYSPFERKLIVDQDRRNFIVLLMGWQGYRYIHTCIIHVEIVDDKVWVQADNTEAGITDELVVAGIPKEQIVLGFQSPFERSLTEFATE